MCTSSNETNLATLQVQPAAEVTDAEIDAAVLHTTGFDGIGTQEMNQFDCRNIARAILALRPQAVPMTEADTARLDWIASNFEDVLLLEILKDLPSDSMSFREAIDHLRGITTGRGGDGVAIDWTLQTR